MYHSSRANFRKQWVHDDGLFFLYLAFQEQVTFRVTFCLHQLPLLKSHRSQVTHFVLGTTWVQSWAVQDQWRAPRCSWVTSGTWPRAGRQLCVPGKIADWRSSKTQAVCVGKQDDQFGFILLLFRKLQETQISTTSKLEEAEHKVQTLQTGGIFSILVKSVQGRLKRGEHGRSPGPPGPLWSLSPCRGEPGRGKGAPASPPWLLLVTHVGLLVLRWEDLNYISVPSTMQPFFLLFFQPTCLNHCLSRIDIWNNIRGKTLTSTLSEVKENSKNRPLKCKRYEKRLC